MTVQNIEKFSPGSRHPLDTTSDLYRMLLVFKISPEETDHKPLKSYGILRDTADPYNRVEVCLTVPPSKVDFRTDRVVLNGTVQENRENDPRTPIFACQVTVYLRHSNDAWIDILPEVHTSTR